VLLTKYYLVYQIEKNEIGGARSTYGEKRCLCRFMMGKPEDRRAFGRPRHRWGDDIKIDMQDVG
jgi:ferredoxin-thioredoxin reductase catalytic subunit